MWSMRGLLCRDNAHRESAQRIVHSCLLPNRLTHSPPHSVSQSECLANPTVNINNGRIKRQRNGKCAAGNITEQQNRIDDCVAVCVRVIGTHIPLCYRLVHLLIRIIIQPINRMDLETLIHAICHAMRAQKYPPKSFTILMSQKTKNLDIQHPMANPFTQFNPNNMTLIPFWINLERASS